MAHRIRRWLILLALGLALGIRSDALAREVMLIDIQGAIGPATAAFVTDAIAASQTDASAALILRIDTPGGLDSSMRSIVKAIAASQTPVVGYVAPTGARAASAGTYILYACSLAAMAPGTNLGAATPIQIGGLPSREPFDQPTRGTPNLAPDTRSDTPTIETTDQARNKTVATPVAQMPSETFDPSIISPRDRPVDTHSERPAPLESGAEEVRSSESATPNSRATDSGEINAEQTDPGTRKAVEDAAAYLRSLAELHGRNAQWAERSVRQGESLSAEAALELGVIDLIAEDLTTLLAAMDGRRVKAGGQERVLQTSGVAIVERLPGWKTRLLEIISDPNLAYILLLIGIYGLVYEFANPGAVLPGTVGAVSLLLALYAFQLLPINYTGVALILLGLAMMIAEAFVPSFGALGLGGATAFVVGSLILIDTEVPGFGVALPLIFGFALSTALLFFFVIGLALKAHRRTVASGAEELIGASGEAVTGFPGEGSVHLHGEIWSARSKGAIASGTIIRVVDREGLTLLVEPVPDNPARAQQDRGADRVSPRPDTPPPSEVPAETKRSSPSGPSS